MRTIPPLKIRGLFCCSVASLQTRCACRALEVTPTADSFVCGSNPMKNRNPDPTPTPPKLAKHGSNSGGGFLAIGLSDPPADGKPYPLAA
jgi:hypothetical protein